MYYIMLDLLFMLFHLIVPTSLWNLVVLFDFTSEVEESIKE